MTNLCSWHLCNNPAGRKFCSVQCKNKFHVSKKRKRLKEQAVEYKGGRCEQCGYNTCLSALEFHHLDTSKKDFGIAANGYTRSWSKLKDELDKCILVCSNCHKEIHENLRVP